MNGFTADMQGNVYMKKEKLIRLCCALMAAVMLAGCTEGTAAKDNEETTASTSQSVTEEVTSADITDETAPATESQTEEDTEDMTEKDSYQIMIERSLMSSGNSFRMKKAINKARNGEPVTLAYLGGSITEGAGASNELCYATRSYESFKEMFGKDGGDNVKMVNAGMGGTASSLGVIRYKRDVLDKAPTAPDIVFIEFAVNDYQEATQGKAYESLIREILSADNEPAVVLVFSVFKSRWNMQNEYKGLGKIYKLPMVSVLDAVVPALDTDKILTDEEYFSDEYHPTEYGHQIMSDCISYMFEQADRADDSEDSSMPEKTYYGDDYCGIKMLDSKTSYDGVKVDAGSFTSVDKALAVVQYNRESNIFPDNWMHESGSEPFRIEAKCKNMLFVYKETKSDEFGSAEIYVDGELVQTVSGKTGGGWNNSVTIRLFADETAADHTIEVKMKQGDEDKKFSILAVGYTE